MPDNNQFKDEPNDPSRDPFKLGLPDTQGIGVQGDRKGIYRIDVDVPGAAKGSEPAHINLPLALDPSRHPDPGSAPTFSPPPPVGPVAQPHVDVQPYMGPNFGAPFGTHWEGGHLVHNPLPSFPGLDPGHAQVPGHLDLTLPTPHFDLNPQQGDTSGHLQLDPSALIPPHAAIDPHLDPSQAPANAGDHHDASAVDAPHNYADPSSHSF